MNCTETDQALTLLTKKQVSQELSCSESTVTRRYKEWHIRHIHLTEEAKSLRFIAEDVQRFIRERLSQEEQNAL